MFILRFTSSYNNTLSTVKLLTLFVFVFHIRIIESLPAEYSLLLTGSNWRALTPDLWWRSTSSRITKETCQEESKKQQKVYTTFIYLCFLFLYTIYFNFIGNFTLYTSPIQQQPALWQNPQPYTILSILYTCNIVNIDTYNIVYIDTYNIVNIDTYLSWTSAFYSLSFLSLKDDLFWAHYNLITKIVLLLRAHLYM